jgi:hexosaminidase
MKLYTSANLLLVAVLLLLGCRQTGTEPSSMETMGVRWELLSNFAGEDNVFEAKFTLTNHGRTAIPGTNWALFFNMAPRPILENAVPQAARVQHLNGDWYKLTPEPDFRLEPGEALDVVYQGREGVIKETDAPLGLYVVWYNDQDGEGKIVPVVDYTISPFTRKEQINRNPDDLEPIPTAGWRYENNRQLSLVPAAEIQPLVPSPVSIRFGRDTLQIHHRMPILAAANLQNEAAYLASMLKDLTGKEFQTSESGPQNPAIRLAIGPVRVKGIAGEAYQLQVSGSGITAFRACGPYYRCRPTVSPPIHCPCPSYGWKMRPASVSGGCIWT